MKILCVIDSLGSGGAQRQLVNLAIAFKEKGHEVSFLVYHSEPFYYHALNEHGIPVVELIEPNYFKRLLKMRKAIRAGNYDSVLSFLEAANFIATVSGFPFRTWHLVIGERSANPDILKLLKLRFFRLFHVFSDATVANSYENIKLVKKVNPLLSNAKLHVIYNLIDFDKWQPKPDNYVFRDGGKFNLIVVASHQRLKNLNGLVEAVKLLDDNEKGQLIVNWYGGECLDDSKTKALEKIEKYNLNKIFNFHEPTINIAKKVNEADALGLFSFYEGLPNVVCEAMANAKPIICSNVSDVPLLINKHYCFSVNDTTAIAQALSSILAANQNELSKVGQTNYKNALQLFNSEKIINDYLSILKGSK